MDGPRGYWAEGNEADTERRTSYDLSHEWNLKRRVNTEAKQRETCRYTGGIGELGERGGKDSQAQTGRNRAVTGM